MATARARHEWDMAANVLALIHNVNCIRRSDYVRPEQLNPYRASARRRQPDTVEVIDALVAASKGRRL